MGLVLLFIIISLGIVLYKRQQYIKKVRLHIRQQLPPDDWMVWQRKDAESSVVDDVHPETYEKMEINLKNDLTHLLSYHDYVIKIYMQSGGQGDDEAWIKTMTMKLSENEQSREVELMLSSLQKHLFMLKENQTMAANQLQEEIIEAIKAGKITQTINLNAYETAFTNYQTHYIVCLTKLQSYLERQKLYIEHSLQDMNKRINERIQVLVEAHKRKMNHRLECLKKNQLSFIENISSVLTHIQRELELQEMESVSSKKGILPLKKSLYFQETQKWFAKRYYILEGKKDYFTSSSFRQQEHHRQFQEIIYFFQSYKMANCELDRALQPLMEEQQGTSIIQDALHKRIEQEIEQVENEIVSILRETFSELMLFVEKQQNSIQFYEEKWLLEKEKLGV